MKAVVLVGPTAVGKTGVSLKIAQSVFEIISVDSVQVYKHLDIGSGKIAENQRNNIEHYLIDIVYPDYWFTAGDFCKKAKDSCEIIYRKNRLPLFCGGTGLYVDSFFKGLSEIPDVDISVKDKLSYELKINGIEPLYEELKSIDPVFATKIHFNDKQRILRGLEVFRGLGRPISDFYKSRVGHESDETLYVGLFLDRPRLKELIDNRIDTMLSIGFVDEVAALREKGYGPELNSMKSIGYLQINEYLDGKVSLSEAVETIKLVTKRYAKRQMTWFKKNKKTKWFLVSEHEKISEYINFWLDDIFP